MTVKQRQNLLAYLGYYVGDIDGIWGELSRTATKYFQLDFFQVDSKSDGVCGVETEKALAHAVCYGMPAKKVEETGTFWDEIKHFRKSEFACKCGNSHAPYCDGYPHEIREEVVRIAEQIREHFGVPCDIVSGLRCDRHNADCGGVWNSQHKYGEAVDIHVRGVRGEDVLKYVLTISGVRYAYQIEGSENVHFDIPKGVR